jgi:hypothetical protein
MTSYFFNVLIINFFVENSYGFYIGQLQFYIDCFKGKIKGNYEMPGNL